MVPAIQPGDIYFVYPVAIEDVKPRDIITAYVPRYGVHVVHRVISLRYDVAGRVVGLVTKGDANAERDGFVTTAAELVGRVE